MARYPDEIAANADLLTAGNRAATVLAADLSLNATEIEVLSTEAFPDEGVVTVGDERIKYTAKSGTQFLGCTRGFDGSIPAAHEAGAAVEGRVVAAHHNLLRDEIVAIETELGVNPRGSAADVAARFGELESGLSGKADLVHEHALSEVTGLESALSAKADIGHQHEQSDITGLADALAGKADVGHGHGISDVLGLEGVLSNKADLGHGHAIADTTGLQAALDSKSQVGHGHGIADVSGLQTALDGKASVSHAHAISDVTGLQDELDGKASVSHGHAISDVAGLQAALDGKASVSHGHAISDVTGLQTALDGKAAAGHGHEIADVNGLETALNGKADASHGHAISDVTGLQTELDGKASVTHGHEISDVAGLQAALDEKGTVGRVKLTANKTYYVRTDGNNGNSGEENTPGGAWATVAYACQWVAANVNLNGYTVTIQIGDGTYSGTVNIYGDPIGPGWVIVQGNPSNYNAVVLDTTGTVQNTLYVKGAAKFIFRYLKIQCTASGGDRIGIYVDSLAYLRVTEINMGSVVAAHFCASEGGQLLLYGNIGIGSGAGILFYTKYAGRIVCSGAAFTLSGTPNFSTATAYAIGMSLQLYYGTTFSGSATGKRYDGRTLSLIDTNGGGASYFPGNAAGTVITGAIYN